MARAARASARWLAPLPGKTVLQARLRELIGKSSRSQHVVLVAQSNTERCTEAQHHLSARLCTPGLEEAHVARRYIGRQRKVELAETAARSPVTQERRKQTRLRVSHGRTIVCLFHGVVYLSR